jgi:vacuolar-type H+-ATPase subunit H
MHQIPEHPEFIKTVREIKDAEEKYDRLITAAKEKADSILRKAKENIADERSNASEELVKKKNEQLRAGSKDIEDTVEKMVKKAKGEAAKISSKKLPAAAVSKIVKGFFSGL